MNPFAMQWLQTRDPTLLTYLSSRSGSLSKFFGILREKPPFVFLTAEEKIGLCAPPPPGGYSWEFLVGVCCPVFQILSQFQTKNCHFPHPFSDLASKIQTRLQTWYLKNYAIISYDPLRLPIFLFFSYSFGIETLNTFIHSRSSLKNHTRFRTKMGKMYTRFQTKTTQNPYPLRWHIPIWLI